MLPQIRAPAPPELARHRLPPLTSPELTSSLKVLILLDRTYLGRFWTQFEGWLSMQRASPDGLVSADESARRCIIECVHGAPDMLKGALVEEWSQATAEMAHRKLSASDVSVTNASDKALQLPKLFILDNKVREIARAMGLHGDEVQTRNSVTRVDTLAEASERAKLAEENAILRAENSELKAKVQHMDTELSRLHDHVAQLQQQSSPGLLGLLSGRGGSLTERASSSFGSLPLRFPSSDAGPSA